MHELQTSSYDAIDVFGIVFARAIVLLPVIVAMRRTGQKLESIGINGKDKGRMLVLGLTLSAISLTVLGFPAPSVGGGFAGFSISLVFGLVYHAVVGFSEEIVWRGYIQTRMIAHSGTLEGLVATSLLFATWHFPMSYFQFSGVVLEALASALTSFPPGLLFGCIMLRS